MFRLYNVTGGEIVSQLNSSSGGVRAARGTIVVTLNRLLAEPDRSGPATLCDGGDGSGVM